MLLSHPHGIAAVNAGMTATLFCGLSDESDETFNMQQEMSGNPPQRVVSVDALRGYAMFINIAALPIVAGLVELRPSPVVDFLRQQSSHADWHGLTYYDLGVPVYLLLIGTAIAFSLKKQLQRGTSYPSLYATIVRRTVILFFLGFLYDGGVSYPWGDNRIAGVLQRLAICYFFGSVLYLHLNTKGRCLVLAAILFGYWAMMALIPVPGYSAGDYSYAGNLSFYVDRLYLPGNKQIVSEGLLSTLPSVGSCLVGVLLGEWLQKTQKKPQDIAITLLIVGIVLINIGHLWGAWFPINKRLWTSSFVVATAGWGSLHLFLFYQISEVWQLKKWIYPFVVFGRSAIAVYIGVEFIDFLAIARRFVGGPVGESFGAAEELVVAITAVSLVWLILYWFNRNKIDIKI